MSVGSLARRALGPTLFNGAAILYRRVFVNLRAVARVIADEVPQRGRVLDIGGGDGAPLNYLMRLRPDIEVVMIDTAPSIGGAIAKRFLHRVERFPGTTVQEFARESETTFATIVVADVIHHIPPAARPAFFNSVKSLVDGAHSRIVIKEIEPEGIRARLAYWADLYISGDRNTAPISRSALTAMLQATFGPVTLRDTPLFEMDRPNYAVVFDV